MLPSGKDEKRREEGYSPLIERIDGSIAVLVCLGHRKEVEANDGRDRRATVRTEAVLNRGETQ